MGKCHYGERNSSYPDARQRLFRLLFAIFLSKSCSSCWVIFLYCTRVQLWSPGNKQTGRTNCQFYTRATSAFMTHTDSLGTHWQACPSSDMTWWPLFYGGYCFADIREGRETTEKLQGAMEAPRTQLSGHLSLSLLFAAPKILSSCTASRKFFVVKVYFYMSYVCPLIVYFSLLLFTFSCVQEVTVNFFWMFHDVLHTVSS